jgi:multiple sugar transport system permease protein
MGYAITVAWVLLVIILVFTLLQFRLQRRWVHYA